jgi:transcriptional repressor NrdR
MNCPQCNSPDNRVIDSRASRDGFSIRRRRECNVCGARFTTLEEIIRDGVLVEKRSGEVEDFDQRKLMISLKKVFEKRPVETERIHWLVQEIMRALEAEYDSRIPSRAIAEQVMKQLKQVDSVAWVRYASRYRSFSDGTTEG